MAFGYVPRIILRRSEKTLTLTVSAAVFLVAAAIGAAAQADLSTSRTSTSGPVLTLENTVKLPDYPLHVAWSPDGKTVAVSQFHKGELRLVDVESRLVSKPVVSPFAGNSTMVWSPQGDRIATMSLFNLRVFSQPNWREEAHLASPYEGCIFQQTTPPAFTADGKHLWIACIQNNVHEVYTAAIKLEAAKLNVVDQLRAQVGGPGMQTRIWRNSVRLHHGTVTLSSLLTSSPAPVTGVPHRTYDSVRLFDLSRGIEISAPIDLTAISRDRGFRLGFPQQMIFDLDAGILVIRAWTETQQVTVVNSKTQELLATLATLHESKGLADMRLTTRGHLVIGAAASNLTKDNGLYVWNAKTGGLLQIVPDGPVSAIELSHDETKLAAVVLNELHIYRLKIH